jgi:transcriptional regulator with XRE-family HTH domain
MSDFRNERGLSQKEAAQLLGVSQAAISAWETGARQPGTPLLIDRIHRTTGIPKHVIAPNWYTPPPEGRQQEASGG